MITESAPDHSVGLFRAGSARRIIDAMETGAATPSERPLADVLTLPAHGEVLPDARGGGRWIRVSWHQEADLVVLSLWREGTCVGTARVSREDVPVMVNALISGLAGTTTRG